MQWHTGLNLNNAVSRIYNWVKAGASTPYKGWSKCSMEKIRGEVFAAFFRKLRGS